MKRLSIPATALLVANIITLCVAAFQKWGYQALLAVFWWETVIIGFYNVGRIFVVAIFAEPLGKRIGLADTSSRVLFTIGLMGLFVFKFGGFALAMGLLVLVAPAAFANGGNSAELSAVADGVQATGEGVLVAVAALFISHGVSFVQNFVRKREYERCSVLFLLFWPYARLALLMLVILLGFAATGMVSGLARVPLFTVAVIALKLFVDMLTHRFEHRRKATTPTQT
jgi:hypothetical protein